MMNNNKRSNQNVNISLSRSDDKFADNENELDEPISCNAEQKIDTSQMELLPQMWYFVKLSAKKSYSVCIEAGEKLAWFFGITKPKYHTEIQQYERMDEGEREAWRQAFQDVEHTDHIRDSIR